MSENKCNEEQVKDAHDDIQETLENSQYQGATYYHGSGYPNQYQEPVAFHPVQPVFVNPNPPDFTYLTPYPSSADLQHITPGPLYEFHYQYNQSPSQLNPYYPMIPPNYDCHHPSMPYTAPFFHNGFFAPIHPSQNIHPFIPGSFYPTHAWQAPQYASHYDTNPHNQQLSEAVVVREDDEITSTSDQQARQEIQGSYIVQEPEESKTESIDSKSDDT